MLAPLLGALELKCNNTACRPVMDAIDLLQRYLDQPLKEGAFFDPAESVPLAGVVPEHWRAAVVDDKGRVERIPYELCVLVALRDPVRRREVWVVGANRYHPRRQPPHPLLQTTCGCECLVDEIERNNLGQLAQVPHGKHTGGMRNDTIGHCSPCGGTRVLADPRTTTRAASVSPAETPSAAPRTEPLCERHWA